LLTVSKGFRGLTRHTWEFNKSFFAETIVGATAR